MKKALAQFYEQTRKSQRLIHYPVACGFCWSCAGRTFKLLFTIYYLLLRESKCGSQLVRYYKAVFREKVG